MSDYLSKLKRGSGFDAYGNAYQFSYEKQAVAEIERLTAELQAKDKRIAELEKTNAQLNHDIGGYVDETARLRDVVFAATNVYQWAAPTSELEQADMLYLYDALAAAQEGE